MIYLGGTNGGSNWRSELIPMLNIPYTMLNIDANPNIDFLLYTVTPLLTRFNVIIKILKYSKIYEEKLIVCILENDICPDTGKKIKFDENAMILFDCLNKILYKNNSNMFWCLESVANYVNEP